MKAPLALLSKAELRLVKRRRAGRVFAAKARAKNPELLRQRVRESRKKMVARGYYKKGGKGYRPWKMTEARREYMKRYNANRR